MVAVAVLADDVLQNVVYLATPPLLWLFLYLFAWESPTLAQASGFGRLAFWLLLPGSLLGTIANLPFAPVGPDILAINIGGGIVPLLLSAVLLRRRFADQGRAVLQFAALFAIETVGTLTLVILAPSSSIVLRGLGPTAATLPWSVLGVVAIAGGIPLGLVIASRFDPALRRLAYVLSLASLALILTFLTTAAIAGVGIVSTFPGYLLAPALVGAVAVWLARPWGGLAAYEGLAVGYGTATLGVLVGADVLRQPPLYAPGAGAIYSIGGAGLLDLLYLSGLLALVAAFFTFRGLQRFAREPGPPVSASAAASLTPTGRLRHSFGLLVLGQLSEATQESTIAANESRSVARALAGLPPAPYSSRPWGDLGAPPWADGDHANLEALARQADVGPRDAWRAHLTARYLVRLGRDVGRRRFGSAGRRGLAFALDLLVLTLPAVPIWAYLSVALPGSPEAVIASPGFNAAALGYGAYALLYFVIAEVRWGTTVGKHAFRLRVRDRSLRHAGTLPVVVRDLPKLLPLSLVGIVGAIVTFLLLRGVPGAGAVTAGGVVSVSITLLDVSFFVIGAAVGLALCALASVLAIIASGENQRLGDYLAGTWVIQE
ncbi:MAG: RDD family protein [Thermoplasmata archaeon]|nr:RDD family protein [Thermoplasmata archaeon]